MILPDTSVWLAMVISGHVHHAAARAWFDSLEDPGSALFCRATQQSFLRLLTTASVQAPFGDLPLSNEDAWKAYHALLDDDRVGFQLREPEGLDDYWRRYSSRSSASPKLWMDAYLAAFARAGGYTLVTTDRAFRQFQRLDVEVLEATSP